jgi:hypothetical protein
MFYVCLWFTYFNNISFIILTEGLLRKDNKIPQKAQAIPTKAQAIPAKPQQPRHVVSPPPVIIQIIIY